MDMFHRKRIDAELATSEAEGGEIPLKEVFSNLRLRKGIDDRLAAAEARGGSRLTRRL